MNTKHTPGPWYEAKTGNTQGLVVDEQTGANVAVVYDKANARLIAAAPELLETLKTIVADYEERMELYPEANGQPNRIHVMKLGRAAISKAERKEQ